MAALHRGFQQAVGGGLLEGVDVVNHALVDTYRWPHEDWIDWTVGTLLHQMFGRASPARQG